MKGMREREIGPVFALSFRRKKQERNATWKIEVYNGNGRITKKGLFSGSLQRKDVSIYKNNSVLDFLIQLKNVVQVDKNVFVLDKNSLWKFILFAKTKVKLYIWLADKKLHYISTIKEKSNADICNEPFLYIKNTGTLFLSPDINGIKNNDTALLQEKQGNPIPVLYLSFEDKKIRCIPAFWYQGLEITASSKQNYIIFEGSIIYRNFQKEHKYENLLETYGAKHSVKKTWILPLKCLTEKMIDALLQAGFRIYLIDGKQSIPVKKAVFSSHISYDMDWFDIKGKVNIGNDEEYTLADVLKGKHGKVIAEIGNTAIILPQSLQNISRKNVREDSVRLKKEDWLSAMEIASDLQVDVRHFLKNFRSLHWKNIGQPDLFQGKLREYQNIGASWIYSMYCKKLGCCLADDMGLGKTAQTIAFLAKVMEQGSSTILIVVPKIVLFNWQLELHKFIPGISFFVAYGHFKLAINHEIGEVILTTYDTLVHQNEEFFPYYYDAVILDESQYLKNYQTQRYRAVRRLQRKFTLALSGTPVENNLVELWSLMNLLNPGMLGSLTAFKKKFLNDKTRLPLLKEILQPFILQRKKEDVLQNLPTKTEQYVFCQMGEEQKEIYNRILHLARNEVIRKTRKFGMKDNSVILQAFLYLREACTEPRLLPPSLQEEGIREDSCKEAMFQVYAKQILRTNGKIVVFCQFPRVLQQLQRWSIAQGWNTFYIDGQTRKREEIVKSFELADEGLFFISLKAGGVGLNLTSAQYAILYEPWWNVAVEQQAADRIYRIGQEKPVFIYHFIVKDTIEEKMIQLQEKKKEISQSVVSISKNGNMNGFSIEEIIKMITSE